MFAPNSSGPAVPARDSSDRAEPVHLLLVKTPSLTQRGRNWLERSQAGAFDALELQRLIRFEKLSLG